MKKIFVVLFAASFFASCGDGSVRETVKEDVKEMKEDLKEGIKEIPEGFKEMEQDLIHPSQSEDGSESEDFVIDSAATFPGADTSSTEAE